jgi:hypothetical protein
MMRRYIGTSFGAFRDVKHDPSCGVFFLLKMTLSEMPYEIVRLITSNVTFKDALHGGESCIRLASLFDFNVSSMASTLHLSIINSAPWLWKASEAGRTPRAK